MAKHEGATRLNIGEYLDQIWRDDMTGINAIKDISAIKDGNEKKVARILLCFIFVFLCVTAFTVMGSANSAEPPALTIVVVSPPDDLTLSIRITNEGTTKTIELEKTQKAWEATYRLYYWTAGAREMDLYTSLGDATLVVQSGKKSFECQLHDAGRYNKYTLNFKNESLTVRTTSLTRSILLVSMRVVLTLLIEGFVFFLFGYRKKASWLMFLIVNIITQGFLNLVLNLDWGSYALFPFIGIEVLIFIAEMITFPLILKEHKKGRAVLFALSANFASLILGGILLLLLPV